MNNNIRYGGVLPEYRRKEDRHTNLFSVQTRNEVERGSEV
jgi:hypothetical protein